jgi:hypothetical protein
MKTSSTVTPANTVMKKTSYSYNARFLREVATEADNATWTFGYNGRNEVTSGVKKTPGNVAVPGHSYGYASCSSVCGE